MARANGPYFVDGGGPFGQGRDSDITDYNHPDPSQPGLWCQWIPTNDGTSVEWDGGEKFYNAPQWMAYLIHHFLNSNGEAKGHPGFEGFTFDHTLNGVLEAQGDAADDAWQLAVIDNRVTHTAA